MSFRNSVHSARQYDNSVLSKIGTVHDNAQSGKREGTLTGDNAVDDFHDGTMESKQTQQNSSFMSRYFGSQPPLPSNFNEEPESTVDDFMKWLNEKSIDYSLLSPYDSQWLVEIFLNHGKA